MMWLTADQDKTNYAKRSAILLLFGLLKVGRFFFLLM